MRELRENFLNIRRIYKDKKVFCEINTKFLNMKNNLYEILGVIIINIFLKKVNSTLKNFLNNILITHSAYFM